MNQKIIIRFSELTTKGKNRMNFIRKLDKNLRFSLAKHGLKIDVKKDFDKFMLDFNNDKLEVVEKCLTNLIGISSYTLVNIYDNYEELEQGLFEYIKTLVGTFKVIPKIRQKGLAKSSDEFKRQIAKSILDNSNLKVDVIKPDHKIVVEAFIDKLLLHTKMIKVPEGLPVGSNGRSLSLLSGGIDSPVASYLIMKRGMSVDYITFLTPPKTTQKTEEKIIKIANELAKFSDRRQRLYLVNYTKVQNEISHISDERYRIVLMRRSFLRIASKICENQKMDNLLTGDSLGQVASQTINGLKVSSEGINEIIIRPLITMPKNEIINISKNINTYELSISEGEDTCSMFVPKSPVTQPKIGVAKKLEDELMMLSDLEDIVIKEDIQIIEVG